MHNDITCYSCTTVLQESEATRFAGVWTCGDCHTRLSETFSPNPQDLDNTATK